MFAEPSTPEELERLEAQIDGWLLTHLEENPAIEAVERDTSTDERRWFVRIRGEEKGVFTVWVVLRQRGLHFESYMMPAPEENHALLYEHLLRRNAKLIGYRLAIGHEDAIYLMGEIPNATVTESELDRMLGSAYEYMERCFRPAMRIGYASKFKG